MSQIDRSLLLGVPLYLCCACGGASASEELEQSADETTQPAPSTATGGAASKGSGGSLGADEFGLGGSESDPDPHPLFFAGEYASFDAEDPCAVATIWKEETAIDLETGSLVIYEQTLWELTGTISENWALPDCTPPGRGWCGEQYGWVRVGTC